MSWAWHEEIERSEKAFRECVEAGDTLCAEYYADRAEHYRELLEQYKTIRGDSDD